MRIHGFLASIVALVATGGIYFTLTQLAPTNGTIVLLLALLFVAVGALAIPSAIALNNRFAVANWETADSTRVWRQAGESGAFAVLVAIFQLRQSLSVMVVLVLLTLIVLIESIFIAKQ